MKIYTSTDWYALLAADEAKPVWYCTECGYGSTAGPCPVHGGAR